MSLFRLLLRRNAWLASLLLAALVLAPLGAGSAAEASEDSCTLSVDGHVEAHADAPLDAVSSHDDSDGRSEPHEHHAHGCGSCHLHILAPLLNDRVAARAAASPQVPRPALVAETAPLSRLYRPPRA